MLDKWMLNKLQYDKRLDFLEEKIMINNKVAVITGASKGIGRKTAEVLANEGFKVVVNYNSSEAEAEKVKKNILDFNGEAEIFKADVGNYNEAKKLIEFCVERYGSIDVLINNAGISQIRLFTDIGTDEWNEMIRVNLNGIFNCTQNAVRHMIRNKQGKIINLSSIWGITGASCEVHYSTVKAGIIGFTKSLAKELGPSNIQVNCVAPGVIMTGMMGEFSEDEIEALKLSVPLQRLGTDDDVANVILFLSSDKSNYITGQVISPNGGMLV